jgi:hypothetical protein
VVTVADIVTRLDLQVMTPGVTLEASITGGYASDLLSCVMAGAQSGNVWVTLQAHPNVVAVASLLELSCVIVAEGTPVEQSTLEKAEREGIPVLSAPLGTFSVVERLSELGIHGNGRPE